MIFMPKNVPMHGEESKKYDPYPKYRQGKTFTHGNSDKYIFYNPGNTTADIKFMIRATETNDSLVRGGGLTITNETTNQRCRYSKMPGGLYYYLCDSMTGECYYLLSPEAGENYIEDITTGERYYLINPETGTKKADYLTHDYGFIQLAPGENTIMINPDGKAFVSVELYYKATFN